MPLTRPSIVGFILLSLPVSRSFVICWLRYAHAKNSWELIGNDNRDACSYSPASAERVVTVGASTLGDEGAYFFNFGKCVDIFGPGLNILSTYRGSEYAVATLSGTSMASPHTAGLLAYLLYLSIRLKRLIPPSTQLRTSCLSTPNACSQRPALPLRHGSPSSSPIYLLKSPLT